MSIISRESLLARSKARKTQEAKDPKTGDIYIVQQMTIRERDHYDALLNKFDTNGKRSLDLSDCRAQLLAYTVSEPSMTADEWGSLPSDDDLGFLIVAAQRINGIGVEQAEKNSESVPVDASSSDSPSASDVPSVNSKRR